MFGSDYAYIAVEKKGDNINIICNENIKADKNGKEKEIGSFSLKGNTFYLRIQVEKGGVCRYSFSDNGEKFTAIEKIFVAKPGRWVGAKLGLFCSRNNVTNDAGYADVDWFRIEPLK